uniref:MADS-box domain-containing protein n=1 Tax=Oryza punctata TaxID=4537 RepID=A0A0E0LBZ7_ORYPU
MGRPRGGTSMGKKKIEIRCIGEKGNQQVTSSKRRRGLFKKASELSRLSGASIAVVAFSKAGNVFAFGAPSVDAVLRRHVVAGPSTSTTAHAHDDDPEVLEALKRATDETTAEVAAEEARLDDVAGKITGAIAAGRRFWWEADVEALGEAELPEFVRALQKLRGAIVRRRSGAKPTPTRPPRIRSKKLLN